MILEIGTNLGFMFHTPIRTAISTAALAEWRELMA